jgi:hypothetical protein
VNLAERSEEGGKETRGCGIAFAAQLESARKASSGVVMLDKEVFRRALIEVKGGELAGRGAGGRLGDGGGGEVTGFDIVFSLARGAWCVPWCRRKMAMGAIILPCGRLTRRWM